MVRVVRWPEQRMVWMAGCPELTQKIQTVSNINK